MHSHHLYRLWWAQSLYTQYYIPSFKSSVRTLMGSVLVYPILHTKFQIICTDFDGLSPCIPNTTYQVSNHLYILWWAQSLYTQYYIPSFKSSVQTLMGSVPVYPILHTKFQIICTDFDRLSPCIPNTTYQVSNHLYRLWWAQSLYTQYYIPSFKSSVQTLMGSIPVYPILHTLEPRYNTIRYNTNSDITRMRFGPQFSPNLPFFISLDRKYVFQTC